MTDIQGGDVHFVVAIFSDGEVDSFTEPSREEGFRRAAVLSAAARVDSAAVLQAGGISVRLVAVFVNGVRVES